MKFRSQNLLVTGGAGFIGSNFIKDILDKYHHVSVYNLDSLTYASNLDNTSSFKNNSKYKFIKGDICNIGLLEEIFNNYEIDGVINFAAETHVDNSIINPDIFIKTNIEGVFNLLNTKSKFLFFYKNILEQLFIKLSEIFFNLNSNSSLSGTTFFAACDGVAKLISAT